MSLALNDLSAFAGREPQRSVVLQEKVADLVQEMLHAMGQPLTTLQCCRLLAARCGTDTGMVADLADQVDGLTDIYQALRMLLETQTSGDADTLRQLVEQMEVRWRRSALRRRAQLEIQFLGGEHRSAGTSVETALEHLFEAALRSVPVGGRITVTVNAEGELVRVAFLGGNLLGPGWRPTWKLRAAEALLGVRQGGVVYSVQPFGARVEFACNVCAPGVVPVLP